MDKSFEGVIEDVIIDDGKNQPVVIVNFPNEELQNSAAKFKCDVYNDQKNDKTVILSDGKNVYKGNRPDTSKDSFYTMIAIRNKKTGRVRLVQAEYWNVAPVVNEEFENNEQIANNEQVANNEPDEAEKMVALIREFGSKKLKRRTEELEKMKISVNNSMKEQLEETVSNIKINRSDLQLASKDEFVEGLCLPPCNGEASHESEIYNINDIIPQCLFKILCMHALEITESDMKDKPAFIVKSFKYVRTDPNSTAKIAMLLYIEAVLHWLNQPIKSAKMHNATSYTYSHKVNAYIIETYSVINIHGQRTRSNTFRDKGIIHCIIMSLIIWNYKLDLELFCTMLKVRVGVKKLIGLARWIGAVQTLDNKSVILKLPLPTRITKAYIRKNRTIKIVKH